MKKLKITFGETHIYCETAIAFAVTNGPTLEKSSLGLDMPITEIIGEVSVINKNDGNVSFDVDAYSVTIGDSCPEWLKPGVRVKVGLYDGTVLLINDKSA